MGKGKRKVLGPHETDEGLGVLMQHLVLKERLLREGKRLLRKRKEEDGLIYSPGLRATKERYH